MKRVAFVLCAVVCGQTVLAADAPIQCDVGPVTKTYGSVPWLVYSCKDSKSLVVVSAPGSAAAPFYFFFSPDAGGYHIRGEGTGLKAITDAALRDLQNLSGADIWALIRETQATKQ
jgi:hypothetical protein